MIEYTHDTHAHSAFSDGLGTIAENAAAAQARGVVTLGCVEHVRRDTDWLPAFVDAVAYAQTRTAVHLYAAVEAKVLNGDGWLDLPEDLTGITRVLAADHQYPGREGPIAAAAMQAMLAAGEIPVVDAVEGLIAAMLATLARYPALQLAHCFSILPKMGLDESMVTDAQLARLAARAASTGACLELNERWATPGERTARAFRDAGAPVVLASDAHTPSAVGDFSYATILAHTLDAS